MTIYSSTQARDLLGFSIGAFYNPVCSLRILEPDIRLPGRRAHCLWGVPGLRRLQLAKVLREQGIRWRLIAQAVEVAEAQGWAGFVIVAGKAVTWNAGQTGHPQGAVIVSLLGVAQAVEDAIRGGGLRAA